MPSRKRQRLALQLEQLHHERKLLRWIDSPNPAELLDLSEEPPPAAPGMGRPDHPNG
jgi:hypothetical protein